MNQREFKKAMLRGQGRCILACRKDPTRYRAAVMWGCSHLLAYDPQCEDSRAWYLCELIRCYPDATPFREAAIQALFRQSTKGWLQRQLEELLYDLAVDSDRIAEEALWAKYAEMLSALRARKLRPRRPADDLRDVFVFLESAMWDAFFVITKTACKWFMNVFIYILALQNAVFIQKVS